MEIAMTSYDWTQIFVFLGLILLLTPILGHYMANVFNGRQTIAHPALSWLERLCYRVSGVNANDEMSWQTYAKTLILFNIFGFLAVFFLHMAQGFLPLNPQNLPATSWELAFNTASSFMTNTNWQAYPGETTLSYLTQMLGLTVQNFLSAATGMAVLIALIRGFTRTTVDTIGNFWADLIRCIVYVLLPLSLMLAVALVSEGVIQNFSPYADITTLENGKQTIPLGPAASQIAIKQLGTNGGGFFNANSSHPFENPTPLSNLLEMLAILLIPAASIYTYGMLIGSKKHGWVIFSVMSVLLAIGLTISFYSEHLPNPIMDAYPLLEGKETRFGTTNSLLWAISTTGTANGLSTPCFQAFRR